MIARALRPHLPAELHQPGLEHGDLPDIEANEGDELEIAADQVINKTTGKSFPIVALPKARQVIIDAGGLIPFTRKLLLAGKGKS